MQNLYTKTNKRGDWQNKNRGWENVRKLRSGDALRLCSLEVAVKTYIFTYIS